MNGSMNSRPQSKWLFAFLVPLIAKASAQGNEPLFPGYVEPYKILTVSAGEPGIISEMLVKEGDKVEAARCSPVSISPR